MNRTLWLTVTLAIAALILSVATTHAQPASGTAAEPWYENEIRTYEAADRANPPAPGQVLFIGSSSIRMWSSVADDMAPAPVLNRGFGGSKTDDVLAVMGRIVFPYRPALIVYYCGDNDLGTDSTDSASAAAGFIEFAERIEDRLPGTPIIYLSIKPSIARWSNWPSMAGANDLVAHYASLAEDVEFVDVGSCLLDADGKPRADFYREDGLHLTEAGYAEWTAIVRPRVLAHLATAPDRASDR